MKLARKMWAADERINNAMTLILNKAGLQGFLVSGFQGLRVLGC